MYDLRIRLGSLADDYIRHSFENLKVYNLKTESVLIGQFNDLSEVYGLIIKCRDLALDIQHITIKKTS